MSVQVKILLISTKLKLFRVQHLNRIFFPGFLNNLVLYVIGLFTGAKLTALSSAGPSQPPLHVPHVQNNVLMSASVIADVPLSLPLKTNE